MDSKVILVSGFEHKTDFLRVAVDGGGAAAQAALVAGQQPAPAPVGQFAALMAWGHQGVDLRSWLASLLVLVNSCPWRVHGPQASHRRCWGHMVSGRGGYPF